MCLQRSCASSSGLNSAVECSLVAECETLSFGCCSFSCVLFLFGRLDYSNTMRMLGVRSQLSSENSAKTCVCLKLRRACSHVPAHLTYLLLSSVCSDTYRSTGTPAPPPIPPKETRNEQPTLHTPTQPFNAFFLQHAHLPKLMAD